MPFYQCILHFKIMMPILIFHPGNLHSDVFQGRLFRWTMYIGNQRPQTILKSCGPEPSVNMSH